MRGLLEVEDAQRIGGVRDHVRAALRGLGARALGEERADSAKRRDIFTPQRS